MRQIFTIIAAATVLLWSCGSKRNANTGWSDSIAVKIMVIEDVNAATERNYVGDISSEKDHITLEKCHYFNKNQHNNEIYDDIFLSHIGVSQ